jgi:hypothetical protein
LITVEYLMVLSCKKASVLFIKKEKHIFEETFNDILSRYSVILIFNTWIRIRIRNTDPDPQPTTQLNVYPYGSGSLLEV